MYEETLGKAHEELKRVDHLIYVSLKYTRTCDVLKNTINRLIACIDFVFEGYLQKAEEQHKIFEIPTSPMVKATEFKKLFPGDEKITSLVEFYILLRKINRAEYTKSNEFRRYVTMHVTIDNKDYNVDIDAVTQYYKDTKVYIDHLQSVQL